MASLVTEVSPVVRWGGGALSSPIVGQLNGSTVRPLPVANVVMFKPYSNRQPEAPSLSTNGGVEGDTESIRKMG